MQKKVLAIGLMDEQLHGIKYAAEQGLYIIGIDRVISEKVRPYIDEFYKIDLKNVEEIISVIQHKQIEFIIPATIGNLLTTIGHINDKFCLPGVTAAWANLLTNKNLYNEHLVTSELFYPEKMTIINGNKNEIIKSIEKIGLPCILKPAKGSGSRGVIVVADESEIDFSINYALNALMENEPIIVEKFVDGQEYGVDFEIINDDIKIIAIRKKILTKIPYRQEVGYISTDNTTLREKIERDLKLFFKNNTMNITSIGNIDVIEHYDQLYFVEMTLRPAGLGIMYNYLPTVLGYNPVEKLIDKLLNKESTYQDNKSNDIYGLFFWDLPFGEIESIDNEMLESVLDYELNFEVGDYIVSVKKGNDIFPRGYFMLKESTETQLLERRKHILGAIRVG